MFTKNFKEAKKEANRVGGVVLWWVSYYIVKAKDYNESLGIPKYVSKKAQAFFKRRYLKQLRARRREVRKLVRFYKQQAKETSKKELTAKSEPHTVIP